MAKQFDVIVIGAGPGGYTAALKATELDVYKRQSIENLKNFICGEREFTKLSVFDVTKREERRMPIIERKQLRPAPSYKIHLNNGPGFYFGRYGMDKIGKPQQEDGHIIIIGAPGSGKTSALAIPTLSTLSLIHIWIC